jgi:glycopeptide antibiotics resistance protein
MGFYYGPIFYVPISAVLLAGFGIYGLKKKLPVPYFVCAIIGIAYVNLAISVTFFPMTFIDVEGFSVENNISLSLLYFRQGMKHLLLNILLTIPLGIGLQFITNMKNKSRLAVIIILSSLFELLQLLILYIFKPIDIFFDVNDLICNIIGGIVGYILILIVDYTFRGAKEDENKGFIQFIKGVCYRCANGEKSLMFE